MLDFMMNSLPLLKGLWGKLPLKLLVLIGVGLFLLGAIGGLSYVRSQVNDEPKTVLTLPLSASVDGALIVLIGLLVVTAIAAVIYAVCYREG